MDDIQDAEAECRVLLSQAGHPFLRKRLQSSLNDILQAKQMSLGTPNTDAVPASLESPFAEPQAEGMGGPPRVLGQAATMPELTGIPNSSRSSGLLTAAEQGNNFTASSSAPSVTRLPSNNSNGCTESSASLSAALQQTPIEHIQTALTSTALRFSARSSPDGREMPPQDPLGDRIWRPESARGAEVSAPGAITAPESGMLNVKHGTSEQSQVPVMLREALQANLPTGPSYQDGMTFQQSVGQLEQLEGTANSVPHAWSQDPQQQQQQLLQQLLQQQQMQQQQQQLASLLSNWQLQGPPLNDGIIQPHPPVPVNGYDRELFGVNGGIQRPQAKPHMYGHHGKVDNVFLNSGLNGPSSSDYSQRMEAARANRGFHGNAQDLRSFCNGNGGGGYNRLGAIAPQRLPLKSSEGSDVPVGGVSLGALSQLPPLYLQPSMSKQNPNCHMPMHPWGVNLQNGELDTMGQPLFRPLTTYSWEQSEALVKIYVPLRGVQTNLLRARFTSTSVEVRVVALQGKNYIYQIKSLYMPINSDGCYAAASKTKKNVLITLQKLRSHAQEAKHWRDLSCV